MSPRRYHAAVWDEPLVLELGAPGRRGVVFGDVEPGVRDLVGEGLLSVEGGRVVPTRAWLTDLVNP